MEKVTEVNRQVISKQRIDDVYLLAAVIVSHGGFIDEVERTVIRKSEVEKAASFSTVFRSDVCGYSRLQDFVTEGDMAEIFSRRLNIACIK